jgi:hypothetical protein
MRSIVNLAPSKNAATSTTSVAVSETIIYTSRLDMVMSGSRMDVNTIADFQQYVAKETGIIFRILSLPAKYHTLACVSR